MGFALLNSSLKLPLVIFNVGILSLSLSHSLYFTLILPAPSFCPTLLPNLLLPFLPTCALAANRHWCL